MEPLGSTWLPRCAGFALPRQGRSGCAGRLRTGVSPCPKCHQRWPLRRPGDGVNHRLVFFWRFICGRIATKYSTTNISTSGNMPVSWDIMSPPPAAAGAVWAKAEEMNTKTTPQSGCQGTYATRLTKALPHTGQAQRSGDCMRLTLQRRQQLLLLLIAACACPARV